MSEEEDKGYKFEEVKRPRAIRSLIVTKEPEREGIRIDVHTQTKEVIIYGWYERWVSVGDTVIIPLKEFLKGLGITAKDLD